MNGCDPGPARGLGVERALRQAGDLVNQADAMATVMADLGDIRLPPAATRLSPDGARTVTGVLRAVVVPSPSCPPLLAPHAMTLPFAFSARLWFV